LIMKRATTRAPAVHTSIAPRSTRVASTTATSGSNDGGTSLSKSRTKTNSFSSGRSGPSLGNRNRSSVTSSSGKQQHLANPTPVVGTVVSSNEKKRRLVGDLRDFQRLHQMQSNPLERMRRKAAEYPHGWTNTKRAIRLRSTKNTKRTFRMFTLWAMSHVESITDQSNRNCSGTGHHPNWITPLCWLPLRKVYQRPNILLCSWPAWRSRIC